jgi:hypothetical protein
VYLVLADIALLIPAFALLPAPPVLAVRLLGWQNAPLPYIEKCIHSFGTMLEPRNVLGAAPLDQ